jgi:hypothetical protein
MSVPLQKITYLSNEFWIKTLLISRTFFCVGCISLIR